MDFALIFWFLVAVAVLAMLWSAFSKSKSLAALVVAVGLSSVALAWAGFWNWILRDGLGPGFEPSSGVKALQRFGSDMLFPIMVCGCIVALSVWRYLLC